MEHEAATKCVDLVLEGDRCVALTALDGLIARVRDPLPNDPVATDNFRTDDLFADVVIQASHQVHAVAHGC